MIRIFLTVRSILLFVLGQRGYQAMRAFLLGLWGWLSRKPDPANLQSDAHEDIIESSISFSIVVPVYNTQEAFLRQCLKSVFDQSYPNWELILVDDKSPSDHVRLLLGEAAAHSKVRVIYREDNGNISAAVNDGLDAATGNYFTVLDHDDFLHRNALYWMVDAILKNPGAEYLYSDEDKTDKSGKRFYGVFRKPGWSPELTLQCMYTCHMSVYDRAKAQSIGGFRSTHDGAQDYDFMLRFISRFEQIHHVKKVLYHWREWEGSTALNLSAKPEAYLRQRKAIQNFLDAKNEHYDIGDHVIPGHHKVSFLPKRNDLVSIIIPTANKTEVIDGKEVNHATAVVQSITEASTYENYEIVLVHDGNLTAEQLRDFEQVKLLAYDTSKGFNFSEKINLGVAGSDGDYLILMNDDTRVQTPNWIERMLGMCQRTDIGAVGAKLLFPDGTIQHGGIWLRGNMAGHIDYGASGDTLGHDLSGLSSRNCIGVTAACQMTPRAAFEKMGGYNTQFPLNYNDVDYCLRLHEAGLRSVCLNDVELIHHEGSSRSGGQKVGEDEITLFVDTWAQKIPVDPYLPSNLI